MNTHLSIRRIAATWSAVALVGLSGLPMPAALAADMGGTAGHLPRLAAGPALEPDADHTGILRIGFNEKLPVTRHVLIGLDKSMIVELPRDLKDVVVSNPLNLDAVVQTSNRVFLVAKKAGDANVFFFDENGEQVLTLEVRIERDMQVFDRMIERVIPGSHIHAEVVNDTMVLSGSVLRAADSAAASEIAARFLERPPEANQTSTSKVINLLEVESKEQVSLRVTVAEVSRELIKRLGLNLAGGLGSNGSGAVFGTNNAFSTSNGSGTNNFFSGSISSNLASCLLPGTLSTIAKPTSNKIGSSCFGFTAEAFERAGLIKTLAEPTLTAISGETAEFQAGGSFPIVVGSSITTGPSVTFKDFGVGLTFTPLVQSEGRITLKVHAEVSDLSTKGEVSVAGFSIPALTVRRANTTIELPSGGAMVIGGLLSDTVRQSIDGIPGLKNVPLLGELFRSRDFQKEETELLIVVTPYIVNGVARDQIALPTDKLDIATDAQANLLGQLNRTYGRKERAPHGDYFGNFGFIVE